MPGRCQSHRRHPRACTTTRRASTLSLHHCYERSRVLSLLLLPSASVLCPGLHRIVDDRQVSVRSIGCLETAVELFLERLLEELLVFDHRQRMARRLECRLEAPVSNGRGGARRSMRVNKDRRRIDRGVRAKFRASTDLQKLVAAHIYADRAGKGRRQNYEGDDEGFSHRLLLSGTSRISAEPNDAIIRPARGGVMGKS